MRTQPLVLNNAIVQMPIRYFMGYTPATIMD